MHSKSLNTESACNPVCSPRVSECKGHQPSKSCRFCPRACLRTLPCGSPLPSRTPVHHWHLGWWRRLLSVVSALEVVSALPHGYHRICPPFHVPATDPPAGAASSRHCVPAILDGRLSSGLPLPSHLDRPSPSLGDSGWTLVLHFLSHHFPPLRLLPLPLSG